MEEEKTKEPPKAPKKKKMTFLKIFLPLTALVLLVYFMPVSSANVDIYPATTDISFEEEIVVLTENSQIDFENKTVPGIVFEQTNDYEENFESTGYTRKTETAKGVIRVYNSYSPYTPLTLMKGTRFLTEDGLIYRALEAVRIPAAESEDDPGYVDIEVEADEAGSEYNTDSQTFTIPGLEGSEYYQSTWAETIEPITGGAEEQVRTVSKEDLEAVEEDFKAQSFEKDLNSLEEDIASNYIYLEETINQELKDISFSVDPGEEATSFQINGKVSTQLIAFREDDVLSLAEDFVLKNMATSQNIAEDSLKVEFIETTSDFENGRIDIKISVKAQTFSLPDEQIVEESILGQDVSSALLVLENLDQIEKAEIEISPFWKKTLPKNLEKITINNKFE